MQRPRPAGASASPPSSRPSSQPSMQIGSRSTRPSSWRCQASRSYRDGSCDLVLQKPGTALRVDLHHTPSQSDDGLQRTPSQTSLQSESVCTTLRVGLHCTPSRPAELKSELACTCTAPRVRISHGRRCTSSRSVPHSESVGTALEPVGLQLGTALQGFESIGCTPT